MKKIYYLLISFYSILILGIIIHYIFGLFNFDWQLILNNVERLESFSFFVIVLTFSLTMLMVLGIKVIQMITLSTIQINLKNILEGRELQETHQSEIDASFQQLSEKLTHLTENLQKSENRALQNEETVIEKERKRIARDLHDTVSQELFAANIILSGVTGQVEHLDKDTLSKQLSGVSGILNTAQRDLRILLLHLRPTELEGKSLVEGLNLILKELSDKSDIEAVSYTHL